MASRRRAVAVLATVAAAAFLAGAAVPFSLATLTSGGTVSSNAFTTAASFDTVAPTVSATVIAKSGQYLDSFVKQGGAYFVYANATDGGAVPTGIATLKADVSAITTGQTAVSLVAGTFTVEGTTYGYRSASLTANASLAAGSKSYTLTSTDSNANSRLQTGFSVTVDNTAPAASDIQTANVGGGTVGRLDLGDTITYTFSEIVDPASILAGWTGASTNVVARFTNSAGQDTYAIWNSANTVQLNLGTVNSKGDYVNSAVTAGASGTPSTMVLDTSTRTITVTLGTIAGTLKTDTGNRTAAWTPSASAFDQAGNAMSTTVRNETGTADPDF